MAIVVDRRALGEDLPCIISVRHPEVDDDVFAERFAAVLEESEVFQPVRARFSGEDRRRRPKEFSRERFVAGMRGPRGGPADITGAAFSYRADAGPRLGWIRAQVPYDLALEERFVSGLVELLRVLAREFGLTDAYAHPHSEVTRMGHLKGFRDPHPELVREVCWLHVLGREAVERYGRDVVLGAPALTTELLADGSVLLRTAATPDAALAPAGLERRARVRAHIHGLDDWTVEMDRLRRRTRSFAPVECDWHPDVEKLLSRIVGIDLWPDDIPGVSSGMRHAHKLRRVYPPPVAEWRPLSELVNDVPEPQEAIERLHAYARAFASFQHRKYRRWRSSPVHEAVDSRDPALLPELDYDVFRSYYAAEKWEWERGMVLHGLGAFLGCLIEEHLGGRWVPASDGNMQIVAGGRVWLPFLRVKRAMRGRYTVLRYSLTQFYRAVERAVEQEGK